MSLEAYLAQFKVLAVAQDWDEQEMAVQLVTSLKGQAVEILGHLAPSQRASYSSVKAALEHRYGHQHQAEAFWARFRARVRRGETLKQLTQELLVRCAYPGVNKDQVSVLLRDYFVDALQDQLLQVYVKQAYTTGRQEALAHALEYESFRMSGNSGRLQQAFRARCAQVRRRLNSPRTRFG